MSDPHAERITQAALNLRRHRSAGLSYEADIPVVDRPGGPGLTRAVLEGRIDFAARSYELGGDIEVNGRDGRDFLLVPGDGVDDVATGAGSTLPQPLGLLDAALGVVEASPAEPRRVRGTPTRSFACITDLIQADVGSPAGIHVPIVQRVAELRRIPLNVCLDSADRIRRVAIATAHADAAIELYDYGPASGEPSQVPARQRRGEKLAATPATRTAREAVDRTLRHATARLSFSLEVPAHSAVPSSAQAPLNGDGRLNFRSRAYELSAPIQSVVHRGGVVMPDGRGGAAVLDAGGLPYPGQPHWVLDALRGIVDATERGTEDLEGDPMARYDCVVDIVRADASGQGMHLSMGESIRELRTLVVPIWVDGTERVRKVLCTLRQSRLAMALSEFEAG
jgi:hypothetical protein